MPTNTTGEMLTWSSRASLESDKNKPLPDPKSRVGLDPDRTPRTPHRDPDVAPKVDQKKPKLKKVVDQIKPPELTHIPKLLPIFVELVGLGFLSVSDVCLSLFWGTVAFG